MVPLAFNILLITAKFAIVSISIFAFVSMLTLIGSAIFIGINYSVLGDIHSLVQMWLPFNLSVIVLWLITAAMSWIGYRLSLVAIRYVNAWLNQ